MEDERNTNSIVKDPIDRDDDPMKKEEKEQQQEKPTFLKRVLFLIGCFCVVSYYPTIYFGLLSIQILFIVVKFIFPKNTEERSKMLHLLAKMFRGSLIGVVTGVICIGIGFLFNESCCNLKVSFDY